MKEKILFLIIALLIRFALFGQSCLPDGILFTTQSEIDNFQINYPNCNEIEGDVTISLSDITNLNGLNVLTHVGGDLLIIGALSLTSLTGLESLNSIAGGLVVSENCLGNLSGLDGLTSIGGRVRIMNNGNLISLTGINALTYAGEEFWICDNANLTSLTGLESLDSINGHLLIYRNYNLVNLSGLNSLTSIKGYLDISENIKLASLTGLLSLKSIDGGVSIQSNQALLNLSGLDSINPSSITDLIIAYNSFLSTCEVKSICDYLSNPNASSQINNNYNGCYSRSQILDACEGLNSSNINPDELLKIFPNPCEHYIVIQTEKPLKNGEIILYNLLGEKIINCELIRNVLDISSLKSGAYILVVNINETSVYRKILVEESN